MRIRLARRILSASKLDFVRASYLHYGSGSGTLTFSSRGCQDGQAVAYPTGGDSETGRLTTASGRRSTRSCSNASGCGQVRLAEVDHRLIQCPGRFSRLLSAAVFLGRCDPRFHYDPDFVREHALHGNRAVVSVWGDVCSYHRTMFNVNRIESSALDVTQTLPEQTPMPASPWTYRSGSMLTHLPHSRRQISIQAEMQKHSPREHSLGSVE
jgi:hypothetical protein